MSYIGKPPNTAIVNQATSQSFSGNGSTTFTLNRSVNRGEDLEVFVENVQQEPGAGKSYTASGTTLTFDAAPPNGTNNIYVIYRGEATINPRLEHDANSALAATTGTFSGDLTVDTNTLKVDAANNRVLIGTDNDSLFNAEGTNSALTVAGSDTSTTTLGNGGAAINIVQTDGTAGNTAGLHFSREDTDGTPNYSGASIVAQFPDAQATGQYPKGKLHFHTSTIANAAPSLKMTIDEAGRVTMPYALAVSSYLNVSHTNPGTNNNKVNNWAAGFGTGHIFPSTRAHGSFDYTNSRFTAPVAGLYLMSFKPDFGTNVSTAHYVSFGINGATRNFDIIEDIPININGGANYAAYLYLNQNDYVEMYSHGGTTYTLNSGGNQWNTWWFVIQLS